MARAVLAVCILALSVFAAPSLRAQNGAKPESVAPNYELAAQWTSQKVSRLVFDTSVTPRWLEKSDRFWYAYQTREGRRFSFVDAAKKTKAPLFDHAKMAATLTSLTGIPYDAQHLPFSAVRFVKDDAAFEFDVQVPRDAVILATPKKVMTTDHQVTRGGDDEVLYDEHDMSGAPQQQQQQGGRGRAGGPAAAPRTRTLHFEYDVASGKVTYLEDYKEPARQPRWASISPDKKTVVFARSHNLYLMDAANYEKAQKSATDASIVEVQLTKDGEEHYSYGRTVSGAEREIERQQQEQQDEGEQQEGERESTDKNARVPAVNIVWARDSSRFALIRRDSRTVKDLWVINSLAQPRPTLETYRYAMPGEENIPHSEMYVFDVASKAGMRLKADRFKDQSLGIPTRPQRALAGGRGGGRGGAGQTTPPRPAEWLADSGSKIYITRQSRDLHKFDICIADTATGEVTPIVEERLNTYIETKPPRLVNNGADLVFWSERDGWGHLYLYDANTGALKNRITEGEFVVTSIDAVDDTLRHIYFTAAGREKGEDPYYTHLYRAGFDGSGLKLLNPGDASHTASLSESNRYFVDNASRVDTVPDASLYDVASGTATKLETTDVSSLLEGGFKYPEPFTVKADDGVTDLYGVMYKPFDFDPKKSYPIVAYVYPGPQTESVTKTFNPRSTSVNLAQFGFIVIEVGNRGGHPTRSKWYHNYGYGNLRDYGLADKKSAIEQLARRHAFIDINRVGIWGHSGGGFMSAAAILVYPDFFKVAWSESGNHENNIYNNTWSEKHHGIKEIERDGKVTFEYDIETNSQLAKNLKGHLMLITGDIDNNVHPAATYRLADALVKANKRFDMFVLPGVRHSFASVSNYVTWLRGDYFARHLLGSSDDSIDIIQITKEQEQVGEKRRR
jgi:dipeptidyl aminopeptidase/acylaminoacyl peptidase